MAISMVGIMASTVTAVYASKLTAAAPVSSYKQAAAASQSCC